MASDCGGGDPQVGGLDVECPTPNNLETCSLDPHERTEMSHGLLDRERSGDRGGRQRRICGRNDHGGQRIHRTGCGAATTRDLG
jgi:hypothetical protein